MRRARMSYRALLIITVHEKIDTTSRARIVQKPSLVRWFQAKDNAWLEVPTASNGATTFIYSLKVCGRAGLNGSYRL